MAIVKIRVPARYDNGGGNIFTVAEFKLGRGPCGKVVASLRCGWEGGRQDIFWVHQMHVDGTEKMFYYRNADLIGRVEVENE
jgi:hypothetical protein